jgi:hypothetical protein
MADLRGWFASVDADRRCAERKRSRLQHQVRICTRRPLHNRVPSPPCPQRSGHINSAELQRALAMGNLNFSLALCAQMIRWVLQSAPVDPCRRLLLTSGQGISLEAAAMAARKLLVYYRVWGGHLQVCTAQKGQDWVLRCALCLRAGCTTGTAREQSALTSSRACTSSSSTRR